MSSNNNQTSYTPVAPGRMLAYTGTAATDATAIGQYTNIVRLSPTTDCMVTLDGTTPTPTVGTMLTEKSMEYFTITPGRQIKVIQLTAGGSLNITEMTQ